MAEMKKISRTIAKVAEGAAFETLLVVDATTGQNALAQAKEFSEALPVTGVVLSKLDGTAKGGIVLGITSAYQIPVRFVGLGEGVDDLRPFSAEYFANALVTTEDT
jgi:fused signal recognition particle receptor